MQVVGVGPFDLPYKELPTERGGADIAHFNSSVVHVPPPAIIMAALSAVVISKLNGRHSGGLFELAAEYGPAHTHLRGHVFDCDRFMQAS